MFNLYFEYILMGIILLPGILFALYAQVKVVNTYREYSKVGTVNGQTAFQVARNLLDAAGLENTKIIKVAGELTDHFDPRNNTVALSAGIYNSTSVAALGIACHEVGHAIQHSKNYTPAKLRMAIIPFSNAVSTILWPLVFIGLIFNFAAYPGSIIGDVVLWAGIGLFGLAVILNLITLPVEFNASNRALKYLSTSGILNETETVGAKKVLSSAALTYVAALLVSILNLLRFVMVILMNNRRR